MAPITSRYRVERRLGAGGMAEVYLAQDTELERPVAVKVLLASLAEDPDKRKRFRSAAKAASVLTHANICMIHEVGETDEGRPFMAMEYVEGQTLDLILQQRQLRVPELVDLALQVAEALDAAHARGIVHRDIKPANIVVGPRGQVKVLDFGLAKRFGEEALSATTTSVYQTQTGVVIGTPNYMSPEQVLGREVDGRTDIFSLGVVMYEALAGQRPFLGRTMGEVLNNVVNQDPEPIAIENPTYSPALDNIVTRCLQKNVAQRYASARMLADELLQLRTRAKESLPLRKLEPNVPARNGRATDQRKGRGLSKRALAVVAGIAGIALVSLLALGKWPLNSRENTNKQPPTEPVSKSVAVLPFNNFSGEPEMEYLSDGFTEEITAALSRVPGLKVAARNSAFTFKGKNEDVRKMGQALRVSTLLEGSIRKDGRRIRVSARLLNVATGYQLWTISYDRPLDDVLAVQQEIADRIAEKLQGKTPVAAQQARAVDPEAYTLYLQARQFWNKRTPAGLRRSVQLFESALEKDPSYAAAQSGLAAAYLLIPEYVYPARHSEYRPLAKAAAERALQLDQNSAEAHAVLAMLLVRPSEAKAAEEHFRRAIELSPNFATAHHWYGNLLTFQGRLDEGLEQYNIALELDPLSPVTHSTIAQWHYYHQDYERAVTEARKVVETFPDFLRIREILVLALIQKGDFTEALKEVDEARKLEPETPLALLDFRAFILARLGREQEARAIQVQFEDALRKGQPAEGRLAFIYAGLREYDKLIDMLELKNSTDGLDAMILKDPMCKEIRDLPRFKALVQRAGLEGPPQKRT